MLKRALVCGSSGFIGTHLVANLKKRGFWVRGVDLKNPEYKILNADDFQLADLRIQENCIKALEGGFDEVYQLAADMGGAGYIFTKEHDADIMHNSALINLNMAKLCSEVGKIFYSSSACIYPDYNQIDPDNPKCSENSAYPANPDSCYGWEKLFSEQLYLSFQRNYGLKVKIARFHNIFGPYSSWNNGKEKAPAALCRKVTETIDGGEIEIWGPGNQTRSFLFIEECLEAIRRFMDCDFSGPLNIGSEEMISINNLAKLIMSVAKKNLKIKNIPGPIGVMGRVSENSLMREKLGWVPSKPLRYGIEYLYHWIASNKKESL
jgi:nucleoside-diphosphate-sugar epimerase